MIRRITLSKSLDRADVNPDDGSNHGSPQSPGIILPDYIENQSGTADQSNRMMLDPAEAHMQGSR